MCSEIRQIVCLFFVGVGVASIIRVIYWANVLPHGAIRLVGLEVAAFVQKWQLDGQDDATLRSASSKVQG